MSGSLTVRNGDAPKGRGLAASNGSKGNANALDALTLLCMFANALAYARYAGNELPPSRMRVRRARRPRERGVRLG